MEEATNIDLAPFLAAMVENAGGEIRVPVEVVARIRNEWEDRFLTIDFDEQGHQLVFRLLEKEEVPDEVRADGV